MRRAVPERIIDLLGRHGCWHETFGHEPVRTSEEAARVRPGYTLQQGAKALIVRAKDAHGERVLVMLVMPADRRFDKKKLRDNAGLRNTRFATAEEVAEITGGVEPGGVPPFGGLFGLDVICDPALFDNEKIVFNAGDRAFSVGMRSEDYRRIAEPRVVDIT
ncbi:MAG: YbaK/EbsC family protein [Candidatus Poribacteria bacterium]